MRNVHNGELRYTIKQLEGCQKPKELYSSFKNHTQNTHTHPKREIKD